MTQCELARELIAALKMGEDLMCDESFAHLMALGIAPGNGWSYEDSYEVVPFEEIKDVIMDVQHAHKQGNVSLDGFAVAEEINRFCLDMRDSPPSSSDASKGETPSASIHKGGN